MKLFSRAYILSAFGLCIFSQSINAAANPCATNQTAVFVSADTTKPSSPKRLPGKGLLQHDFLYTGEWDYRKPVQTIFLVHDGKLSWTYEVPTKDSTGAMSELGDASMRINGNIVFSTKLTACEISPDHHIIWKYPSPKGTEIHIAQPLDTDRIFIVINGVPALAKIINIKTGITEREMILPTGKTSPHLQFRRVRMLESGNILAAHLDDDKVVEYDSSGKVVWSYSVSKPWSAGRLTNGNTLITSSEHHIREVNVHGDVVWEMNTDTLEGIPLYQIQGFERLDNGNTVFSNWCPKAVKDSRDWPGTVQLLEISPDKKLVWALRSWSNPDLGPASSIQILTSQYFKSFYRP